MQIQPPTQIVAQRPEVEPYLDVGATGCPGKTAARLASSRGPLGTPPPRRQRTKRLVLPCKNCGEMHVTDPRKVDVAVHDCKAREWWDLRFKVPKAYRLADGRLKPS